MPPFGASPEGRRRPFTKALLRHTRRLPPARCDVIHRCASLPYLLLLFLLLLLLLLLLFFSSVGLQRAKRSPNFFFLFWDQNDVVLVLFILKRTGQNDAILALFSLPTPFSSCFQPDNSSKFCPSLNHSVEK